MVGGSDRPWRERGKNGGELGSRGPWAPSCPRANAQDSGWVLPEAPGAEDLDGGLVLTFTKCDPPFQASWPLR